MKFNQKGMDALLNMASKKMGTSADDLKRLFKVEILKSLHKK